MRDDLTRLIKLPPADKRLEPAEAPVAIRDKVGLERRAAGEVVSTEVTVESTDGLFLFTVRVVS
jgi:hypothetical protein